MTFKVLLKDERENKGILKLHERFITRIKEIENRISILKKRILNLM